MREDPLPAARHEPSDIGPLMIWGGFFGLSGFLVAAVLLILWLYPRATLDRVLTLPLRRFPAPELQTDPARDMQRFRAQALLRLNGTGWVDRGKGIAHEPIGVAMRQIVQEGWRQ